MSLVSFLLSGNKKRGIDDELDSIFRSQPEEVETREPAQRKRATRSGEIVPESETSDAESSQSGATRSETPDEGELKHETTVATTKPVRKKAKYAPSDETKESRDARTIFVGNLSPEVAVKRPLRRQLCRHVLTFARTAKIESTRFRSVAFQSPTSKPPETDDGAKTHRQLRQHERDRVSSWRDANSATGEATKTDEKKFLTPNQKKKIAFINKDIHSEADSVHAYIVFAHPPSEPRPANLPPLPPIMDPFEAARMVVEGCDGTVFLDRMLRVDAVVKRSTSVVSGGSAVGDPKLSVFVGNVDFACKEEDLRVLFEGIVSAERGPPQESQEGDKPRCWVTRVRMVRDRDTQLGKGFAYVQFADRTCVDEILALDPGKIKLAKRKLRVQRCKSVINTASKHEQASKLAQTSDRGAVPKGDPSLGEKLAKLTKEERKRVKAADADRVARRMAKKKARMALSVPAQGKRRERVRKPASSAPSAQKKATKGRVRSEKSLAKRNVKK